MAECLELGPAAAADAVEELDMLGVEADMDTLDSVRSREEELILSRAANTSFFMRTNNLPDRQGFCKFKGLKSSLRHLSRDPMTATGNNISAF